MAICLDIRCPNCGNLARRRFLDEDCSVCQSCPGQQITQTECPVCDYLMVMCWQNGKVFEAHAPGISAVFPSSFRSIYSNQLVA